MQWQYRTIVFEFQKDGLLGDRFIDDEEVERSLNEEGSEGWELVSATMVQDGLLTLLKRPALKGTRQMPIGNGPEKEETATDETGRVVESAAASAAQGEPADGENCSAEELQKREREHIRNLEQQRRKAMKEEEEFMIGEIKIS